MRLRNTLLTGLTFIAAATGAAFVAGGAATVIEVRSRNAMNVAMETQGFDWVQVQTDGLQVVMIGTAPTEAERFRAVTQAATIVDGSRIVDNTDVASIAAMTPPSFSLTALRNEDGIQLIGLVPASTDRAALVSRLRGMLTEGKVTDLLETADYPEPAGWPDALRFAADALQSLQRAKLSVNPGAVRVEAIADSPADKNRIETSLARARPGDLKLISDIAAPRPVITPFTLRFLIDEAGPRFDACSADTERARERILAAAQAAGAQGTLTCTVGMGVPSPQWADAVVMAIGALDKIGSGVVTFSDADVFLSANPDVPADQYDQAIGELESNLPPVFSLKTELQKKPSEQTGQIEFRAVLHDGKVDLLGRVAQERDRTATESFARAAFGAKAVHGAMRLDPAVPPGWPRRVMSALTALSSLSDGSVVVTADDVRITGTTGDPQASDTISRVLAEALGEGAPITINVRYDRRLDPALALPDGPQCVERLNTTLAEKKITFEPGSAVITSDAMPTIDALARQMKDCQEFPMEIGGYTDSQGRDEMNLELSQDRAQSVLAALQGRGLWTGNLMAKGYGEENPIDTNDTEAGRENNRRIEFRLVEQNTPAPQPQPVPAAEPPAEDEALPEDQPPMEEPMEGPMEDMDGDGTPQTPSPQAEQYPDGIMPQDITVEDADKAAQKPEARPEDLNRTGQ